jgi:hypothetical protein
LLGVVARGSASQASHARHDDFDGTFDVGNGRRVPETQSQRAFGKARLNPHGSQDM